MGGSHHVNGATINAELPPRRGGPPSLRGGEPPRRDGAFLEDIRNTTMEVFLPK